MSDWRDLVGILGPDLLKLVASTIQEAAAARAQRPVAELTHDDLRAAAAELVARSVPVDGILERTSGGVWHRFTGPGASGLPLGGGEDYTSPRAAREDAAALPAVPGMVEVVRWDPARFVSPQLEVVTSTDLARIVADPEDDATKAHGGNA